MDREKAKLDIWNKIKDLDDKLKKVQKNERDCNSTVDKEFLKKEKDRIINEIDRLNDILDSLDLEDQI